MGDRLATSRRAAVVATAVALSGPLARADGGAANDAYDDVRERAFLDMHGLADVYLQHDLARLPRGSEERLRAFDVRDDTPSLQALRATLGHRPDPFGFRLDAAVGDLANGYLRSDPARAEHPELSRRLSYLEQGFVTAVLPWGRGLALDLGKFGTPVGLEDNESHTNWSYSRSLLYTFAEPTYHTGLRATYVLTDRLAASAFWINGWNANVLGGNGMRTGGLAISWDATEQLSFVLDYLGGPERAPTHLDDATLAFRHELDAYVTYAPAPYVAFATTADYGRDAASGGVSWWGIGGYLRLKPSSTFAGTLRAEHFADPQGFTTGAAQRVNEVTVTVDARTEVRGVTLLGRVEGRRDQSDVRVFADGAVHQDTVTVSVAAWFLVREAISLLPSADSQRFGAPRVSDVQPLSGPASGTPPCTHGAEQSPATVTVPVSVRERARACPCPWTSVDVRGLVRGLGLEGRDAWRPACAAADSESSPSPSPSTNNGHGHAHGNAHAPKRIANPRTGRLLTKS